MEKREIQAIILAAGKSSRFNTGSTKLSFTLCGQEMIAYPAKVLAQMNIPMTFVVGFQKQAIKQIINNHAIPNTSFIEQEKQLGTGHALLCSQSDWHAEHILVLNGDVPLITQEIIEELITTHREQNATISFVATLSSDTSAAGLGRVIRDGKHIESIEARHCTDEQLANPLNAGIYLFNRSFLEKTLHAIPANEKSGEIYITDLIKHASDRGLTVATMVAPFDYVRGVNTLKELWAAEHIKRSELLTHWMNKGVRFAAALNVCIDLDVEIGAGTFIGTGAVITKGTRIGSNCIINAFSFISNTIIHDEVDIKPHSAICDSIIHKGSQVGPFAHLNNSIIQDSVIIGNFVEVKRSTVGAHSKAKHLSYIGDACLGEKVNIGAGAITCNYNGVSKHETVIHDGAFIGGNCVLVAPITIGKRAMTAAGSTITNDVPENAVAFGRSRQENKEGYAQELRERWTQQELQPSPIISTHKVKQVQDH